MPPPPLLKDHKQARLSRKQFGPIKAFSPWNPLNFLDSHDVTQVDGKTTWFLLKKTHTHQPPGL